MKRVVLVGVVVGLGALIAWGGSRGGITYLGIPVLVWQVSMAFMIQWLVFVHSWTQRTEKYFDVTGSATYILVTLFGLLASGAQSITTYLLTAMVVLWAARLGTFLFRRISKSGKDDRFEEILKDPIRLFLVWTIQGLWISLTALAAWIGITTEPRSDLGWIAVVGIVVWLAGFTLEIVADTQKTRFRADPANKQEFIRSGVWSWSRHPNYFGEIVLWTGVLIVAAPQFQGWQWIAVLSPVFVTLLLTKVSGIPLLEKKAEKKWGDRDDYRQYKEQTSVLIPLPPRN